MCTGPDGTGFPDGKWKISRGSGGKSAICNPESGSASGNLPLHPDQSRGRAGNYHFPAGNPVPTALCKSQILTELLFDI